MTDRKSIILVITIDTVRKEVRQATPMIKELNDGYIFKYDNLEIEPTLLQFVDHEQKCCVFLDFEIYHDDTTNTLDCQVILNNDNLDLKNVKEVILALFSDD